MARTDTHLNRLDEEWQKYTLIGPFKQILTDAPPVILPLKAPCPDQSIILWYFENGWLMYKLVAHEKQSFIGFRWEP